MTPKPPPEPFEIFEQLNPERAQLSDLGTDRPALTHAAKLERVRREKASKAADHWAD